MQLLCAPLPTNVYGVIYLATHREDGMMYVGQTVQDLKKRWGNGHVWRAFHGDKRSCSYLSNAIVKYGPDAFTVETLDHAISKEELDAKERFWIAFLDTRAPNGYNLKDGGARGKPHPESEAKRKASRKDYSMPLDHPWRKRTVAPMKGRKMPPEYGAAIRERTLARIASGWEPPMKGKKFSLEKLAQMRAARRPRGPVPKRRKPVLCVETGQVFDSVTAAQTWSGASLSGALKNPHFKAGGYHWVYVTKPQEES